MTKKNVLEYLEEAKKRFPWKVAVDDGQAALTYQELYFLSRQIGSTLAEYIEAGKPVPVLMEKSSYMLAVMLGVVYAGGFYVPIHPGQPSGRLRKMMETLDCEFLITTKEYGDIVLESGCRKKILYMEALMRGDIREEQLQSIRDKSRASDLLYGIFTSGSTGEPKGIVVSHGAVISFIGHFTELFGLSEADRIGNQAPFDFDVSVKDIYSVLSVGASLILIQRKLFAVPPKLMDYLIEKRVTTLIWAVSALCLVSGLKCFDYQIPGDIRTVMFSGEVMPVKQLAIWQRALPKAQFINLYGPTEITCNCTYYKVEREFGEKEHLPIGRAFPGRYVYLLDENGQQVTKPGQTGEICVAGESLSEGYYRNPALTSERFFMLRTEGKTSVRAYRTGDLGYMDETGMLYFAGRRDFQIKLMGHRIELEEIERTLDRLEGVGQVCCIFEQEQGRILAFYTGEAGPGDVRRAAKKDLPPYMIPGKIIHVDRMPMNKNGKTDRQELQREGRKKYGV